MSSNNQKIVAKSCKFLGLKTDPRSLASYPSVSNCCYGCLPEAVPSLVHQREFCLTPQHKDCPVFTAENPIAMPADFSHKINAKSNSNFGFFAGIVVVGILLGLIASTFVLLPRFLPSQTAPEWSAPQTSQAEQVTLAVQATSAIAQDEASPSPAPTETPQPQASPTPTSAPSPTLEIVTLPVETLLGTNYQVVVHRIADGESLSSLSQTYGTTDRAILDATHKLAIPLWVGRMIVIPVNNKSWSGQPALEPYQITQEAITLDELSPILGVEASLLKYYNGCENCLIQKGSWIVVPRAP